MKHYQRLPAVGPAVLALERGSRPNITGSEVCNTNKLEISIDRDKIESFHR